MTMAEYYKTPLRSIVIFGAAGRIGSSLANFLGREAPKIHLRLVTRDESKATELRKSHPSAEVVIADYLDFTSLQKALEGRDGVFLITSPGTDEWPAMKNVVQALKEADPQPRHIIRQVGVFPGFNERRLPQFIKNNPTALPIQHPIVKEVLDESLLPVTIVNTGATFMDNFLWMKKGLMENHKLIWPSRLVPYMAVEDIAEVVARILLSTDSRHIGQFYTINNGLDLLHCEEVAQVMSRAWSVEITYDGSKESFFKNYSFLGEDRLNYLWGLCKFEAANEFIWSLNDAAERILGRKPKSLKTWLEENRAALLE